MATVSATRTVCGRSGTAAAGGGSRVAGAALGVAAAGWLALAGGGALAAGALFGGLALGLQAASSSTPRTTIASRCDVGVRIGSSLSSRYCTEAWDDSQAIAGCLRRGLLPGTRDALVLLKRAPRLRGA